MTQEKGKGDEGIQRNEFIVIIYQRISWVRREEEISVDEGE